MTTVSPAWCPRSGGVLLHLTSLPGPHGIGDLGPTAHAWIDDLARARQSWWQVLPLGPTGHGDSPYQSPSAFAGNPNLISLEALREDTLLSRADLPPADFPDDRVDYERVVSCKRAALDRAWHNFQAGAAPSLRAPLESFCERHKVWVEDFALFMAIKESQGDRSWFDWPRDLVHRQAAALDGARVDLAGAIGYHRFVQFLFFRQWGQLRQYAHARGVGLIGDVPIFVSADSADVWANPDKFYLDEQRRPSVVAGVPPDYFSATGQLWGNPLYDWQKMRQRGFAWWVARMRATLEQVDLVRLDHFRGFESYWEVPAGSPTAQTGRWVAGPGDELFAVLRRELGRLPLIAEDLGMITDEVRVLRQRLGLPGMLVLHFAFGDTPENPFLPHNHRRDSVVYTGTHDNDTSAGWYASLDDRQRAFVGRYVPEIDRDPAWAMIRLAWGSVADLAIVPLQDLLRLGTESRMNYPGRPEGNWRWRVRPGGVPRDALDRLAEFTETYGRTPA